MKTSIKKQWWGKTETKRVRLKEYGTVYQTKSYLFGLCFWTENNTVCYE